MSSRVPDPSHIGADIERLRLVYGNFPLMLAGSATAGCVLVALLYETVPHGMLLLWLLSLLALYGLRLRECLAFRRASSIPDPQVWVGRLQVDAGASGLLWGIGATVFLGLGDLPYQLFTVLVLSGVAAGAMTSYGAMWRGYIAFLAPFQALVELRLLFEHTPLHYPLAVINLLFVGVVLYSAFKTDRAFGKVLAITAENAKLTRALQYQATHDPLVDLVNRRELNTRLIDVADGAVIGKHSCALIFIDLDRFKEVNDQGGHAAGDEALRRVSLILKEHIRATDTAARLGGDEFAILLPGCPLERAEAVARGVFTAIHDFVLHWDGGLYLRVGASIGVAYAAVGEADASSLLRVADEACYAAKNAGRGRVVVRRAGPLREPSCFEIEALRRSV
jgi:diguanylate cyclase (GGDEF)-like protein